MDIDSRIVWCALLIVYVVFVSSAPQQGVGITRFDPKHGNTLLVQDGTVQMLIGGGGDESLLSSLPSKMSWFDKRIEVIIVPTWKSEDIMSLVSILDRYDVGAVVLPRSGKIDPQGEMLISEIVRRHIPYRFAEYGQRITANRITLRIMAGGPAIAFRADIRDVSIIVLGDANAKMQQQLLGSVPTEAFPAKILYAEKHGTKPPSIIPGLLQAISPNISFSDLPYDATLAFRVNSWFMKCVHETDLPFLQHYCMNK
ncbi:MAG: hypothetical protein K8Q97_00735 [Candidatus Andersenbacteria bacterium]|nr:hypothetical protein [Candidatus Andersenbacteria bacterium]